ncbi:MAG: ABC transporter substrate-binding protein [Lachnospirales bacterium]
MKSKVINKTMKVFCTIILMSMVACTKDGEKSTEGGSAIKEGDVTTLTMAWWGNQVRNERTQQALNKYTEMDESVKIEGQFYQWGDYWSKLATLAAGNSMPDIIQMDFSYINQYVESDVLLDLTPYIENESVDFTNINETYQIMAQVGSGNYGLCNGVNAPCMLYNKTLTDEYGIEVKDYMTIDEFTAIAKEMKEKSGYSVNLYHESGQYMDSWSRGVDINIKDKKLGGQSAELYVPYFEILEKGIKEGWQMSYDLPSGSLEQDPLVYGTTPETSAWISLSNSNQLVALQEAAPEGVEIGITTIPTQDAKKSNYLKPSQFFSISANTEHPDKSVSVLNYLINSTEANEILLAERGIPINSEVGKEISPLLSEKTQDTVSFINDVIIPRCSPIGSPDPNGKSEVNRELKTAKEMIIYGDGTPEEAAEYYFTKANEIFTSKNQ